MAVFPKECLFVITAIIRLAVSRLTFFLAHLPTTCGDMVEKGRGMRGVAHPHPELLARGEQHWTRQHPERMAHGEQHWTHRLREKVLRGEKNGNAKLTPEQVEEIKARRAQGETLTQIAKLFQIGHSHVSRIARGKNWKGDA